MKGIMKWTDYISTEILEECIEGESFDEAIKHLESQQARGVIVPMKNMPFERDPRFHISSILPLQDRGFYLHVKGEAKNLSLLGESHTIHYTHDFIVDYIRAFNQAVQLVKIEEDDSESYDYVISNKNSATAISLDNLEFVPECCDGIYAIVCRKEDVDFRQKVKEFHDESTADISNLQRRLMAGCKDYDLRGIVIQKDSNAFLQGVVAYMKNGLQYASHSQSTSHEFVHFTRSKM